MALIDQLESYWKLDEASGNALDAHGSNTLTDTNTVGAATGKLNGGRQFVSANTEYFTIADNASVSNGDNDFTFTFWIKYDSLVNFANPIVKDDNNANREYGCYMNSSQLRWYIFSGSGGAGFAEVAASNAGSLTTGVWYFVVCWHDSVNNQIGIRIFGASSSTPNTTTASSGVYNGTAPFNIGGSAALARTSSTMDEVGYWKRVLSSDEQVTLYGGGTPPDYSTFGGGGGGGGLVRSPFTSKVFRSPVIRGVAC